jgi:hypothetical protein
MLGSSAKLAKMHQGKLKKILIALMMEAASIFETSVSFYQITRRNNPEGGHLHILRRENLKSHKK